MSHQNKTNLKGDVEKKQNIIEGDQPLRDYRGSKDGKPVFETWDLDDWKDHAKKTKMMNVNGQKPCGMCGEVVYYEEMPSHEQPFCEDCIKKIQKYSDHVTLKKVPKGDKD